jgi:hypothetical protein
MPEYLKHEAMCYVDTCPQLLKALTMQKLRRQRLAWIDPFVAYGTSQRSITPFSGMKTSFIHFIEVMHV